MLQPSMNDLLVLNQIHNKHFIGKCLCAYLVDNLTYCIRWLTLVFLCLQGPQERAPAAPAAEAPAAQPTQWVSI